MSTFDPVLAAAGCSGAGALDAAVLLEHLQCLFARRRNAGLLVSVLQGFERQGLAHLAASWVSTGPNLPLSPKQVGPTLGADLIRHLSQSTGLTEQATVRALAVLVPHVIDGLTPSGVVPLVNDQRRPRAAGKATANA
jgi:uncharacterized protein YidB (DUF937 family)